MVVTNDGFKAINDNNLPSARCKRPWIGWLQLSIGLGLATIAGLWLGRAWAEGTNLLSWVLGTVSLVMGVLIAMAGMRTATPPREIKQFQPPKQRPRRWRDRPLPYLGELLVNKYHLITDTELQDALAEQKMRGGRLGQIMVALGLLEYEQLAEVLEDQLAYGDPWRGVGGKVGPRNKAGSKAE